ncbi:MAG TPA: polyketide synthase, partial [Phaeodactylibacter sp.]|nr:polyketide synthase [Phaeodactylibacter sp.]
MYTDTLERATKKLLQDDDFHIPHSIQNTPDNKVLGCLPSQIVNDALGLNGNHYALDAACATSLYAIKLACDELLTGKADMMLAGAVCASDQLFIHIGFSIFHAYAPSDKKFIPLDKDSAGLVSSEGASMVVLKKLEDAERDGDRILGVIGGIGLSNDGRGKFLLSPNPKGQKLAFQRAYENNDISPKDTTYLECHATGTPLGDMTELNSTSEFFQQYGTKPLLGSVKSNLGHLLTAAGMTGLVKVLLAMREEVIPPNINLENPLTADNGWIGGQEMITTMRAWNSPKKQAGINSFGFGGTNAHMVVENYVPEENAANASAPVPLLDMSIIGMGVYFKGCTTLEEYYDTIYFGKQHFEDLPATRWKGFEKNKALLRRYGFEDGKAPKGAYIEDFEIDLFRYKIQPKEALTLEAQQALILRVADEAIQDAGLHQSANVAVLIAMEPELAIHHYLARWDVNWQLDEAILNSQLEMNELQVNTLKQLCKNSIYACDDSQTPSQHTSFVGNIMASRIAALWDFNGPAFTVSCGDNSFFKALEIAQNMLSLGEVEAVVIGGVDLSGGMESVLLRNQQQRVNQSPKPSISYNKSDNGWLVGEGAGAIVLKPTETALEDKTYAVIEGCPGKDIPLHDEVSYIELAATGFEENDRLELHTLLQDAPQQAVALGSVKANIGHCFAASGIAALIKTVLCVYHRFIPGIPNWEGLDLEHIGSLESTAKGLVELGYYFP